MHNDDLIAYLQPAPNRFHPEEWRDVTGSLSDLRVQPHRLSLRAALPPGLYRGQLQTKAGAFDMSTAMVPMVRVPDGQRLPTGPWDLNHLENYMAMPMARTYVNGQLKGGLWFTMPGPEQIHAGRLSADFGFEAAAGETELVLEFIERDRARMDWGRMDSLELRQDNRGLCPLRPQSQRHPRVYVQAAELAGLRKRWLPDPRFQAIVAQLRRTGADFGIETAGDLDTACLVYLLTNDKQIGEQAKNKIVALCRLPTWSGRPDPLLMGGDNDRGVGYRLYYTGVAWECLRPLFAPAEQRVVLAKVAEYLRKMYDFTLLQRAYMGHPTIEPHSLGAWNGVGVACMAFYDELPIARQALPFFHGLFRDSLRLFPPGGKSAWVTFFPFHLIRYLAAAQTFGGPRPELSASPFLDNLGQAMLTCFVTPNTQELQRGLRTLEHRYLSAYLNRFRPTKGIAAIYQAFVQQEQRAAGDVKLTLFDLLYAPARRVKPALFPKAPLFAKDIGDIIGTARGKKTIGFSFSAGLKGGSKASFTLMPHNREYAMPMASLEVSVDGAPVLTNINIGSYGLNSALTNTMCFADGGLLTQGQYLNGDIGPESSAYLRRVLLNDRFIYAHAVITGALHPHYAVRQAERILVADLQTGAIVLADSFAGGKPIRFATHLHCSGSVQDLGGGRYRLTGGQANLIAGIKGGSKGLSDEETGEIFVSILNPQATQRVIVAEPSWFPGYIYGLNCTGKEDISQGRFPRYRRWRLEANEPVTSGSFLLALSAAATDVRREDSRIVLPQAGEVHLANGEPVHVTGCDLVAEAVVADTAERALLALGVQKLTSGARALEFAVPVDLEVRARGRGVQGTIYSPAQDPGVRAAGFRVGRFQSRRNRPNSNWDWSATFGV